VTGLYLSKNRKDLKGNNPNPYAYVYDSNSQFDLFGLDIFYQLFNNGKMVYEGITERDVQERLTEHARDGKIFDEAKYLDDLDGRIGSRDVERSSLHHNKNNAGQLNKRRLDGGFYHSYDPDNLKKGRNFFSKAEIDAKMKNAKVVDVDAKGKIKCN
jgi:hypothetical protein